MQSWNPKTHVPVCFGTAKRNGSLSRRSIIPWDLVQGTLFQLSASRQNPPAKLLSTVWQRVKTWHWQNFVKIIRYVSLYVTFGSTKLCLSIAFCNCCDSKDKGPPLSQTSLRGGKDPAVLAVVRSQLYAFRGLCFWITSVRLENVLQLGAIAGRYKNIISSEVWCHDCHVMRNWNKFLCAPLRGIFHRSCELLQRLKLRLHSH